MILNLANRYAVWDQQSTYLEKINMKQLKRETHTYKHVVLTSRHIKLAEA